MNEEEILERLGAERCDWCGELKKIVQWIMPHDTKAVEKLAADPHMHFEFKSICQDCLEKRD